MVATESDIKLVSFAQEGRYDTDFLNAELSINDITN
jgi:hypothetical protein